MKADPITASLKTLKDSVETVVRARLDKVEAAFHRSLAQLEQRLSAIEQDVKRLEQENGAAGTASQERAAAADIRLDTRLTTLERKVYGPQHPPKTIKRVERDSTGLIAKIIEE